MPGLVEWTGKKLLVLFYNNYLYGFNSGKSAFNVDHCQVGK